MTRCKFGQKRGFAFAFLILVSVSFVARIVGANPGPSLPNPNHYSAYEAVGLLFAFNFPIDMLWFAVMVYIVCMRWGQNAGRLSRRNEIFVGKVVLSSLVIAISGALIDFLAFYKSDGLAQWYFWPESEDLLFSAAAIAALLAVFVSIYLISLFIMRLGRRQSLVPSVAMAAMNPMMWMITSDIWIGGIVLISTLSFVIAMFLLYWLAALHERMFSKGSASK